MGDPKTSKPLLDWLRFLAALMVVLTHCKNESFVAYSQLDPTTRGDLGAKVIFGISRYGGEAVVAFFILSGYLVGGASLRKIRTRTFNVGDYAADRVSRIMLPLVPAVLFTAALHAAFGPAVNSVEVLGNLLSIQGALIHPLSLNAPLWSLSFEVWCYIINGTMIVLLAGKNKIVPFFIISIGLIEYSFLNYNYLIIWYLGAILAVADDGGSSRLGLLFALIVTGLGVFLWETSYKRWDVQALFILAIGFVALVRQLANWTVTRQSWIHRGRWLAGFSYSLYLIHYPVLQLLDRALPSHQPFNSEALALFFLRIAISLVVGWIFYLCFERHTSRVRKWLRLTFRRLRFDVRGTVSAANGVIESADGIVPNQVSVE